MEYVSKDGKIFSDKVQCEKWEECLDSPEKMKVLKREQLCYIITDRFKTIRDYVENYVKEYPEEEDNLSPILGLTPHHSI